MIIYKATNKINGKVYIGQTIRTLTWRKNKHIADSKIKDCEFYRAIRKYGKDSFEWNIEYECDTIKELNEKESYYIQLYNSFENGYNMNTGGDSYIRKPFTDEHKKKIGDSKIGKKRGSMSEEQKQKISISSSGEKNGNYGKKHPGMGKGKIITEEQRLKISKIHKGKIISDETKIKLSLSCSGEKNGNYGKKHPGMGKGKIITEEQRLKISNSLKEYHKNKLKIYE